MPIDETLIAADRSSRSDAMDISRSFIVQAPAGSGKTELLIQRYLKLLAIVDNPEEVVAITFTRKAATEMRLRVIEALKSAQRGDQPEESHERRTLDAAQAVLDRDSKLAWKLTEFPRRMRIQTLDALGAGIARSLPLTSNLGGAPLTLTDSEVKAIYRSAAAATLDWIATSSDYQIAVERVLAHLDNNAGLYIDYVARMLESRDQWLTLVGSGGSGDESTRAVRWKLEKRIGDLIRLRLTQVQSLMPVELGTSLMSLAGYAAENVSLWDPDHIIVSLAGREEVPGTSPDCTKAWCGVAELLLTKDGQWRKRVDKNIGFPPGDGEKKKEFGSLLDEFRDLDLLGALLHGVRGLPPREYSDEQWEVLLALLSLLPMAVSELRRLFGERSVVDHIEVASAANIALGSADDPGDMALLLDYQISHLLVDELQDTSISQYRFLEKLMAGWEPGDGRTLFCVGDPMQSIYRFRNAEVGQFLIARDHGLADLKPEPLVLHRNFRSGEVLVRWFNDTFRAAFPASDDIPAAAIAYSESVSVQGHAGEGRCAIYPLFGSSQAAEAEQGVRVIRACLEGSKGESVAVLVRSRTQLPLLLSGLRRGHIEYQAVEIDRLTDLPEVIDILALTRAICHLGDRIAWLALLRGPWVGLSWKELHRIVENDSHSLVWDLIREDSSTRLKEFAQTMQEILVANATRTLRDRVELAWYALGGPALLNGREELENVYRFLDVVARFEVAGTLPDVAQLETLLDEERVSSNSSGDCRLQVMTMHRAKGLQFDHVILHGLGRTAGSSQKSVLSWLTTPGRHGEGDMIISPVGPRSELDNDPLHRFIEVSENEKDRLEQARLIYVACTRARKSLHLLGHVPIASDGQSFRTPQAGSLLHQIWPIIEATYENAFDAQTTTAATDDRDVLVDPLLRRFAGHWTVPDAPALPGPAGRSATDEPEDKQVEYYWVGSSARHAGTIVHRWLQRAADGLEDLDQDDLPALRPVNERWAERLGVASGEIDAVCDRVEEALRGILNDPQGRWSLFGEGHAELPLSGVWDGRVESVVIDRVRIDEDGVHWIVDYKTGTHEGGDVEGFLDQESERYRPQLQKYAAIYKAFSNSDARVALYFPMLQRICEVTL